MQMILIAALALAGCTAGSDGAEGGEAPQAERPADQPGVAYGGLGETIPLDGLTVRPLKVVEDSRCPIDVDCVWSGRLVLSASVSGVAGEALISSIEPFRLPGGGTLLLASVWPPNVHGKSGPRPPYRFGFRRG